MVADSKPTPGRRKTAPRMNGVMTRKQAADKSRGEERQQLMNGNGKLHRPAGSRSESVPKENIFLFYPNLIGECLCDCSQNFAGLTVAKWSSRIFPHRSCSRIPLLHASPPSDMLPPLQHLLPPRRTRWGRGPALRTINPIRSGSRHGHGSMHNGLSARLPKLSMAEMGPSVPGAYKS